MTNRRILFLQYANPCGYPPVEHSSRILAHAGWEPYFLGIQIKGVETYAFPPHPRIQVRLLPIAGRHWRRKLHYLWFCLAAIVRCARSRPRWVYVSDPFACPVACLLRFLFRIDILYHEHDEPAHRPSLFIATILAARKRVARHAAICVLPTKLREASFRKQTGRGGAIEIVWNCPRKEEIPQELPPPSAGLLQLVYHGNLGEARLPFTLLEAIRELPIRFVITGPVPVNAEGFAEKWKKLTEASGLSKRVQVFAPVPCYELFARALQSDVGVSLVPTLAQNANENLMAGASNKTFDYLICGLPLLVTDSKDWREMIVDPGYGLACSPGDVASITTALRWFLDHPEERRLMGERGRQRCLQEWNYDVQFAKVASLLEKSVTSPEK